MEETNQQALAEIPREPRVDSTLRCLVVVKGRKMRSITIINFSRHGLLLSGNGGMYLHIEVGDPMAVYTKLDGVSLHLQGTVVWVTPESMWRETDQQIALRDVKWFHWESDGLEKTPAALVS
jgi:hypothetical protein